MATLCPLPVLQFFNDDGSPLVGGKLYSYRGGTDTPAPTYTDEGGGTPHTNPIVLDARGEAIVWLDPSLSYKLVLARPDDTTPPSDPIWTVDNVSPTGSGAPINFTSTANLRLYAGEAAPFGLGFLEGYYLTADGGQGLFFYNPADTSAADNNGTILVDANGRRWYRLVEGGVTNMMFGARADGVHEASVLLNAALASGYPVQLRPGTYLISTQSLAMPADSQLTGPRSAVLKLGANRPVVTVTGVSNVVIDGFTIDGQIGIYTTVSNDAVFIDWRTVAGNTVTVQNLYVHDIAGSGITALASAGTPSKTLRILNNKVVTTGTHSILSQDFISDVWIDDNYGEAPGQLIADRPCITASRDGSYVKVRGNTCVAGSGSLGTSVHGISLDSSSDVVCSGNTVSGWPGYGIEIGFVRRGTFSANTIDLCTYGIGGQGQNGVNRNVSVNICGNQISRCGYNIFMLMNGADGTYFHQKIAVVSNNCSAATSVLGDGIHMEYVDQLAIIGNVSDENYLSGISLLDCTNWFIADNQVMFNNLGTIYPVAGMTESGSTAQANCIGHPYITGDVGTVWGAAPTQYNTTNSSVTVTDANNFTYATAHSGLTSPAGGAIFTAKPHSLAAGGIKVALNHLTSATQGHCRFGVNAVANNGMQDTYLIGLNGVVGWMNDILFLHDTQDNPRASNLTSGILSNVQDILALYPKNGKVVMAWQVGGVTEYMTTPMDNTAGAAVWTKATTTP